MARRTSIQAPTQRNSPANTNTEILREASDITCRRKRRRLLPRRSSISPRLESKVSAFKGWCERVSEWSIHDAHNQNERWNRNLLQRLGQRSAHCVQPWLAAVVRRLGLADAVLPRTWLSCHCSRPPRPWPIESGVGRS